MNVDREIALKQELQICESYLGIVYLRYQDRLTYSIEVSPTLLAETIPSLTLQSLVENSVKHACESKRGLVSIALFTREFSDRFELIVKDNGKAFHCCFQKEFWGVTFQFSKIYQVMALSLLAKNIPTLCVQSYW